jgi:hypothetical protein
MLMPMVTALPSVAGLPGHPRKRPDKLHGDKGYDYPIYRRWLKKNWHCAEDRSPGDRIAWAPWTVALGRRTYARLAASVSAIARSL